MKNLIIVFLLLPIFSFGQYGLKDCHVDLILGYDYGAYKFKHANAPGRTEIHSLRIGTNINYPISERAFLVTGFRVASRNSSFEGPQASQELPISLPHVLSSYKWNNIYAEVPFSARYLLKSFGWDNRLYVEGGMQFNFYVFSFKSLESGNGSSSDRELDRYDEVNPFTLSTNVSIGIEKTLKDHLRFFVQTVGRYQLFSDRADYNNQSYHFGIETGLRF